MPTHSFLLDKKFREGADRMFSPALRLEIGKAREAWALKHPPEKKRPPQKLYPFLLIPLDPADTGQRPQDPSYPYRFQSQGVMIDPLVPKFKDVSPGQQYRLTCAVKNLGKAPALLGIAEFLLAKNWLGNPAVPTTGQFAVLGYGGFTVGPGKTALAYCTKVWVPTSSDLADTSLFVVAYDPSIDPYSHYLDALQDRHVARRDLSWRP